MRLYEFAFIKKRDKIKAIGILWTMIPIIKLLCSEIGSEGRNFQFAHHLVLFDLPSNPDLLEQRIGRLDRIGQTQTIRLHVPYFENSAQSLYSCSLSVDSFPS